MSLGTNDVVVTRVHCIVYTNNDECMHPWFSLFKRESTIPWDWVHPVELFFFQKGDETICEDISP